MKQALLSLIFGLTAYFANAQQPFITTWKTDNPGISEDNQITIPTHPGEIYDYTVDWGDGTSDTGVTGNITHTYDSQGIYSISITGDFPQIYFNNDGDRDKLLAITQWGSIQWKSMSSAFNYCTNLDVIAPDTPDLSQVSNLNYMFASCTSLKGTDAFNDWDVSNIIDLYAMFVDASSFNANIGNWNVSKVNNMSFLFAGATSFNQDIGTWDVSQITNMNAMFSAAASFNQPIGSWNVQQVTEMEGMFLNASVFNKDIGNWNVGNVTNMSAMFFLAAAFNQDISNWDTKNVNSFGSMFSNAMSFNQDIGNWVVSSATNMFSMFDYALSFNQDISNWEVDNVTNMKRMFADATSFDQNLGSWKVGKVTTMTDMFLRVTLSRSNYDKLLRGWNDLPSLQNGVSFHAGNSQYCESSAERQLLIETFGWTITDGGENPLCNQDNDKDGVADHLDACLDTPAGATVTTDGCLLLAADNFSIEAIGESCPDTNNAQILITSAVPYDFLATINVTGYDFTNSLSIEDLPPGAYTLCITVAGQAFEQCYALELTGADSISGKALAGKGKLDISIEQGTAPYNVVVNGRPVFQTFSRAFAVDVLPGDYVEVNSVKACEGTFSKVVEGVLANAAFPNPTAGIFELALPGPYTEIGIDVFSMHSQLMSTATYAVSGGRVQLDISKLPEGVYLIKPRLQNPATFKIVKQ